MSAFADRVSCVPSGSGGEPHHRQKYTLRPAITLNGLPGVKWMASGGVTPFLPGLTKHGAFGLVDCSSLRTQDVSENCASRQSVLVRFWSCIDSSRLCHR